MAAGDGVVTRDRQLGVTYLPLGKTPHKQGRIAGENAIGSHAPFAGSLGTQVAKAFDLIAARVHEAVQMPKKIEPAVLMRRMRPEA